MAKGVFTSYQTKGKTYMTYILCETLSEAKWLVKYRGLSEKITSKRIITIPHEKLLHRYSQDLECYSLDAEKLYIYHHYVFVAFLAYKNKLSEFKADDILSDEGVLHKLAHYFINAVKTVSKVVINSKSKEKKVKEKQLAISLEEIKDLLKSLEESTLGVFQDIPRLTKVTLLEKIDQKYNKKRHDNFLVKTF